MRLIYFAPVPYFSYWQRPHYMVRSLLNTLYDEIIWIDPTITRLPRWSDLRQRSQRSEKAAAEPLLPNLTVLKPGGLPLEPLAGLNCINDYVVWSKIKRRIRHHVSCRNTDIGIGRPSRLALWAVQHLPARLRFMDVMDDFPAFYSGLSRSSMEKTEALIAAHCDYFFCSEASLIDKLQARGIDKPVHLIPNGYDMERLPQAGKQNGKPAVIGFVGTIARWFDWEIVIEMARALPEVEVRLIGPQADLIPPHLPKNIHLLPACTVADAIVHSEQFTVGLIPFLQNQLTESVDPIKYYELRALGVPVWSTAFGSMTARLDEQGVSHIYRGVDWRALWAGLANNRIDLHRIQDFRERNDWQTRFAELSACLSRAADSVATHQQA